MYLCVCVARARAAGARAGSGIAAALCRRQDARRSLTPPPRLSGRGGGDSILPRKGPSVRPSIHALVCRLVPQEAILIANKGTRAVCLHPPLLPPPVVSGCNLGGKHQRPKGKRARERGRKGRDTVQRPKEARHMSRGRVRVQVQVQVHTLRGQLVEKCMDPLRTQSRHLVRGS